MPYIGERASRLGHVGIVKNPTVEAAMQRWTITSGRPSSTTEIPNLTIPLDSLALCGSPDDIDRSITVDGSDSEVETTQAHPSVKVGYLRIAGSVVRLDEFRRLGTERYIDPHRVRDSHGEYAFDAALPGAQLTYPGLTGIQSWRLALSEFMESARLDLNDPMTLADGLLRLHSTPGSFAPTLDLRKCPECDYKPDPRNSTDLELTVGIGGALCPTCNQRIYVTDVLRTHDEYSEEGSNFSPLTRVMNVVERLMILSYTDLFARRSAEVFRHTLFVTDGPLALYGPSAPLSRRFLDFFGEMSSQLSSLHQVTGPLMVGVEKSGLFVEHAEQIADLIPKRHVMMLTNGYINRITGRPASNEYGVDEFYGRRFIYRTSDGNMLVVTVPPAPGIHPYAGTKQAEQFSSYPTLRLICEVLDSLRTRMYQNAVIPVALAHSSASLPLGVGRSVLTMMAQQNIPGLKIESMAVRPPTYYGK